MILVIHLVVALDLGRYNEFEDGTKALFKEYILPVSRRLLLGAAKAMMREPT